MPALRNVRRELFCQSLVRNAKNGLNMSHAYRQAGYKGTGQGMWAAASRLLTFDEVKMRVAELTAPAAKKASLSLESLLAEVERVLRDAEADKLHHVRLQALALVLRIHELVCDQGEAEHQFAGAKTSAEILDLMVEELGPDEMIEMADVMRERALADRAEQAIVVS